MRPSAARFRHNHIEDTYQRRANKLARWRGKPRRQRNKRRDPDTSGISRPARLLCSTFSQVGKSDGKSRPGRNHENAAFAVKRRRKLQEVNNSNRACGEAPHAFITGRESQIKPVCRRDSSGNCVWHHRVQSSALIMNASINHRTTLVRTPRKYIPLRFVRPIPWLKSPECTDYLRRTNSSCTPSFTRTASGWRSRPSTLSHKSSRSPCSSCFQRAVVQSEFIRGL